MDETMTREIECIDLDLGVLPGEDKSHVTVRHHCLDLDFPVTRYHDGERLRGRDHSSDRMHPELLNDPVDWRGQHLQLALCSAKLAVIRIQ
jgi:hypothetical protein